MVSSQDAIETAATASETTVASPSGTTGVRSGWGGSPSSGSPAASAAEMTPRLQLEMRAFRNARYHEDRQAFFEAANRWSNFVIVIAGSGAAAAAFATTPHLAAVGGGTAALIGAAQLVFDLSGQARTHLELRKDFLRILAAAVKPGADFEGLNVEMMSLYEGEPNIFHAANALAYNAAQMAYARGRNTLLKVSVWQRFTRHLLHYDPSNFDDAVPA